MSAKLTIDVPDELLDVLRRQSKQEGKTPEQIALAHLSSLLPRHNGQSNQPQARLLDWVGAFESNVSDAAERHDDYLGQALHDELNGERNK